jgi:hypothetical protein
MYHHPAEKINQINQILQNKSFNKDFKILELFCGKGNLTKEYKKYGTVVSLDKIYGGLDSYQIFHNMIYNKELFNLIDLDPYGYPVRFFPDIFLLIKDGFLIVTFSKLTKANKWTLKLMESYFNVKKPTKDQIVRTLCNEGMKHWRLVKEIDYLDLGKVHRIAFSVKRVNACEYCGTTNRSLSNWKEKPEWCCQQLRIYLGPLSTTSYDKLRIVSNYLTGTGFRLGKIKPPCVIKLRGEISAEIKKRKYGNH